MEFDDEQVLAELSSLRDRGLGPVEVFRVALGRTGRMNCYRLIRLLFPLSLHEAKDVSLRATSGKTLEEHERDLLSGVEENRAAWRVALHGEDPESH